MSNANETPPQPIELMFNQMAADQAVMRITLQCLLLNMFTTRPEQASKLMANMKAQVLGTIGNIKPNEENPQGGVRQKQLTQVRAERLFQELAAAIDSTIVKPEANAPTEM